MIRALLNAPKRETHPYAETGCEHCEELKVWRGFCADCSFNYSEPIAALEERESFKIADSTLDFVFRVFDINRRLDLIGDVTSFPLSDIEKEGLFILRDELRKYEAFELLKLRKTR